uniref:Uncharacterized protein n=1 Tax=Oryza brachyantha TaxID=4533 RepID=J3MPN9_ORYBR
MRRQVRRRPRRARRRQGVDRAAGLRLRVRPRERRRRVPAGVQGAVPAAEAQRLPAGARRQGGRARQALLRRARHHRPPQLSIQQQLI